MVLQMFPSNLFISKVFISVVIDLLNNWLGLTIAGVIPSRSVVFMPPHRRQSGLGHYLFRLSVRLYVHPSVHPILMKVISQEHLEEIFSNFAQMLTQVKSSSQRSSPLVTSIPSPSGKNNISGSRGSNFITYGRNVHLVSRMTWLKFGLLEVKSILCIYLYYLKVTITL